MSDPQVEKEAGPTPPAAETPTQEPEKRKREYKEFGEEEDKPTRTCFTRPHFLSIEPDRVPPKKDAKVDMSQVNIFGSVIAVMRGC